MVTRGRDSKHSNCRPASTQNAMNAEVSDVENETRSRKRQRQQQRQRVTRACDQCRHGKLKCDGALPHCSTCADTKKSCSYGSTVRRRGLRTGYVRALECLWGVTFQNVAGSEAVVEKLLDVKLGHDFRPQDVPGDSPLLAAWRASQVAPKIEKLLSGTEDWEEDTESAVDVTGYIKDGSDGAQWTVATQTAQTKSGDIDGHQVSLSSRDINVAPTLSPEPFDFNFSAGSFHKPRLQLPSGWRKQLAKFFSLTHCWLPIVERHAIYRTSYSYRQPQESLSCNSPESGDHALLWAILAYTNAQEITSTSKDQKVNNPTETDTDVPAEIMFQEARRLIPLDNQGIYTIGHVQAFLLLGLYRCRTFEWKTSWFLTGQAILVATELGLNQSSVTKEHERQLGERVWLGCFVLHTLLSAWLNRVPHLRAHDAEQYLPIEESGLEEWEPWQTYSEVGRTDKFADEEYPIHALSTFNHLLKLVIILNGILQDASSENLQASLFKLRRWSTELPEHCQHQPNGIQLDSSNQSLTPNILNLHLVHTSLLIIISKSKENDVESRSFIEQETSTNAIITTMLDKFSNGSEIPKMLPAYNLLALLITPPDSPLYHLPTPVTHVSRVLVSSGFASASGEIMQHNSPNRFFMGSRDSTVRRSDPSDHCSNVILGPADKTTDHPSALNNFQQISNITNIYPTNRRPGPSARSSSDNLRGVNQRNSTKASSNSAHNSTIFNSTSNDLDQSANLDLDSMTTLMTEVGSTSGTRSDVNDELLAVRLGMSASLTDETAFLDLDYFKLLDDYEIDPAPFTKNLGYTL